MSYQLAPCIRQRFFDTSGNPLAGGKLYAYQSGTTTPQNTYTDSSGGTPNANPVILDANGEANVWLDPSLSYKFILKDSSDSQQWSVDGIIGLISADAVATASIQNLAVTTAKINDLAVTTAKLAAASVTAAKLNSDAVHGQTSDTAPASGDELMTYDSSATALKKVTKADLLKKSYASKTTTYTATAEDDVLLVSASAGWTLSLPTAVGIGGKVYEFLRTDDSPANLITIDPAGSETIGGSATVAMATKGESFRIISDNANWQIIEHKCNTEWASYTPTYTGFGTVSTAVTKWRRVGDTIELQGTVTTGTVSAAIASSTLPTGVTIDSTKLSITGNTSAAQGSAVGQFYQDAISAVTGAMVTAPGTSTTLLYFGGLTSGIIALTPGLGNVMAGSSKILAFKASLPVANWAA